MQRTLFGLSLLFMTGVQAQTGNSVRVLHIGDKVPNLTFDHVLNYAKPRASLDEFKAKLIILDFWNTACGSCIALFPHMQSLQDEFKGQVQIVLVDGQSIRWHDDSTKITHTLKRLENNAKDEISLPIVYNSAELDSCFFYVSVPHEVWLDQDGKIIAMTHAPDVNDYNIHSVLEGKRVHMHMKIDEHFDLQEETLQEAVDRFGLSQRPQFGSALYKGYIDGARGYGVRRDSTNPALCTGFYITNMPLEFITQQAYSNILIFPSNRNFYQVKDSAAFFASSKFHDDTSYYANTWSYDLTVPPMPMEQMQKIFQEDLARVLGIHVRLEDRPWTCWVIRASPALRHVYTMGGAPEWGMREQPVYYVRNHSVTEVIKEFNTRSAVPLVDSTGSTAAIDMTFPRNLRDKGGLWNALTEAGFEVNELQLTMKVAIITQD